MPITRDMVRALSADLCNWSLRKAPDDTRTVGIYASGVSLCSQLPDQAPRRLPDIMAGLATAREDVS